jgi:hypothetical protein
MIYTAYNMLDRPKWKSGDFTVEEAVMAGEKMRAPLQGALMELDNVLQSLGHDVSWRD